MKMKLQRKGQQLIIPGTALKIAGLEESDQLQGQFGQSAAAILKPKMTARELISASRFLYHLHIDLIQKLIMACEEGTEEPVCSECGGQMPDSAYVDEDIVEQVIDELWDVPGSEDLVYMLDDAGVCMEALLDYLESEEIVYE